MRRSPAAAGASAVPRLAAEPQVAAVPRLTAPRRHLAVLALLVLLGGARGLYWTAMIEVWRGDEAQHYSYVQQLATGGGIPVLGVDHVSDDAALLYRLSPTNDYFASDNPALGDAEHWGASGEQYEGGQGPTYYALLALPYRLAGGLEPAERLFVLRIASLLLLLTAIPLTWLLAAAIVPSRPAAWLLAPALLLTWQGYNVGGSALSNDALVTPLAAAGLCAAAWAFRRGPSLALAAAAGTFTGLAVLTKPSAVVLAFPLVLLTLGAAVRHRPRPLRALAWAAVAGVTAALPVAPWLWWQARTYAPSSATDEFNAILGPIIGRFSFSRATVVHYLRDAERNLFNHGDFRPDWEPYSLFLLACVALAAVAGAAAALRRRQPDEAFGLVALAAAVPVGFATMVAVVLILLDGYGTVVGRYLNPAWPGAAVVIAGGALLAFGRRAGVVAVALVMATALTLEVEHDRTYAQRYYLRHLPVSGLAPAVLQDQGGAFLLDVTARIDPPCPAALVTLAFRGTPPPTVEVREGTATAVVAAPLVHTEPTGALTLASYRLAGAGGPIEVHVAAPEVAVSPPERDPRMELVGAPGDPFLRVYCPSDDPEGTRFAQMQNPLHPDLSYGAVLVWAQAWAAAGWAGVLLALIWAVVGRRRGSG